MMLALVLAMAAAASGSGRTLPVAPFHAVDLVTRASVEVGPAPVASAVATGDPRLVRCVTADVRDGRLVIGWAGRDRTGNRSSATGEEIVVTGRADCRHEGDAQRLLIRVAAPAIDGVAIGGQGVVRVSALAASVFTASIPGRGSIIVDRLHAGATRLSIGGIGRIAAMGELGRLGIAIAGSGTVDTRTAHASAIDVAVAGHGDIVASVDGPASGSFGGTGTIAIGGHPGCGIRKSGAGRIICPAAARQGSKA